MCSGVRDAQNLAFKLDLVLRGQVGADLLDTYQAEREPHVRWVVQKAIELGRVQTVRDPAVATARDARLLAQRAADQRPAKIRVPGLECGFLSRVSGAGRGELSVQGFVDGGSGRDRLDTVVGTGFHFLATTEARRHLERAGAADALRAAGITVVGIGQRAVGRRDVADETTILDVDGTYAEWFSEHGWVAVAIRPDFYVYGGGGDLAAADALAAELLTDLGAEPYDTKRQGMNVDG